MLNYPHLVDAVVSVEHLEALLFLQVLSEDLPFSVIEKDLKRIVWHHSQLVERLFIAVKSQNADVVVAGFAIFQNLATNSHIRKEMWDDAHEEFHSRLLKHIRRNIAKGLQMAVAAVNCLQVLGPEGHRLDESMFEALRMAIQLGEPSVMPALDLLFKYSEWDVHKTRLLSVPNLVPTLRNLLKNKQSDDAERQLDLERLVLGLLQNLSLAAPNDARVIAETPDLIPLVVERFEALPLQAVSVILFLSKIPDLRNVVLATDLQLAERVNKINVTNVKNAALITSRTRALKDVLMQEI